MQFACPRCAPLLRSIGPRKLPTSSHPWTSSSRPSWQFQGAWNTQSRRRAHGVYTSARALHYGDSRLSIPLQPKYVKTSHRDLRRAFSSTASAKSRPEAPASLENPKAKDRSRAFWKRKTTVIGLLIASALAWQATKMLLRDKERDTAANRASFKTYTLVEKERVSTTASIFYLRPTDKSLDKDAFEKWLRHGIMNLELKQPQIQVVRAYTPLPGMGPDSTLRFLVRQEPQGEVSSWLHRLPVGTQLEMRGPNYELAIPQDTKSIVFLAGGTGIAPALQAAHSLLQQPRNPGTDEQSPGNGKQIHILWANRHREECIGGVSDLKPPALFSRLSSTPATASNAPSLASRIWKVATFQTGSAAPSSSLSPQDHPDLNTTKSKHGLIVRGLEALKSQYPGQVTVSYFVDEESTFISETSVRQTLQAINGTHSPSSPSASSAPATQILVSGPDGFIGALAGPKLWMEGRQVQGPVDGIVRKVLLDEQRAGTVDVAAVGVYKI